MMVQIWSAKAGKWVEMRVTDEQLDKLRQRGEIIRLGWRNKSAPILEEINSALQFASEV